MLIRSATYADIDALLAIFAHARQQMAADGNPTQWGDGYPERSQLLDDIQRNVSYVIEHEGHICGTFVFILGDDPTYHLIEDGAWLDDIFPMALSTALPRMALARASSALPSNGVLPNAQTSALTPTKTTTACSI